MAKFKISDCFSLTGRGTILIGKIIEGEISSGDLIQLSIELKIKSIEDARTLNGIENVGLLVDTQSQREPLDFEQAIGQTILITKPN